MYHSIYVAEPNPVVRLDLDGALTAQFPHYDLFIRPDLSEVEARLNGHRDRLIVSSSLTGPADMEVLRDVASRGVPIIFLGETVAAPFPASTLLFPFSTEMVIEALSNGVADLPERPLEGRT